MNLTAEQFADVLNNLGTPQANVPDEKRRASRVAHRCRVPIILGRDPASGTPTGAVVKDFSPRGICLMLQEKLDVGDPFVIALSRQGARPIHILCTVAHCKGHTKSLFVIGAEFTCLLDAAATLPARPQAAADMDRIRRSVLD